MPRVLVVDDEAGVRESLRMILADEAEVELAADVPEALERLDAAPPDLVLLDLGLPGRPGADLLDELRGRPDAPPVVVLSGETALRTAVGAMQRGAADYLTKPVDPGTLRIKLRRHLERRELEREVETLRARVEGRERLGGLIGGSDEMQRVFHTLRRLAGSKASVLIRGESGTGKELAARAVHELGPRAAGPFVAVNCGAIPETLIESELFGHERGAFTDARERRIGRFEQADGGTLFLDEVGEVTPALQPKLLRALQERRIERVGGRSSIPVDVRVIAATHRDLERDVAEGRFRADLFYRLHVVPLELPPLRERRGDVRRLTLHFLERARAEAGRGPARLSDDAIAALERHAWPGNVRELQNAVERAVALAEDDEIELADLPPAVVREARMGRLRDAARAGELAFHEAVAAFERDLLQDALERADWNQTRAAASLGVTRRVLKLKMDRHGLKSPLGVPSRTPH